MNSAARLRRGLGVGAVVLAVAGTTAVGFGVSRGDATPAPAHTILAPTAAAPSSAAPSSGVSTRRPTASPTAHPAPAGPVELAESTPVRIRIGSIGVDASFVDLGLTASAGLAVPSDPAKVGWFTGAHTPGARGVAVVAGHVTWNGAKGAFFGLGDLQRGNRIVVDRADGSRATFAVTRMSTFPKDAFPTSEVYRASATPVLVLITCGGTYHRAEHYYDANVIAWASLVAARPARS